ncbi:MAG TPA: hypothetical protein VM097_09985 [Mycobacteriales bacterium]|nr:hypothetical protein [Mycobacteriales bacterium]
MKLLTRAPATPVHCPRCGVTYRPALTAGTCPVCDSAPGGEHGSAPVQRDLLMPIVVIATVVNVVLLTVLAIAVARVS